MSDVQIIPADDSRLQWTGRTRSRKGVVTLGFPGVSMTLETTTARVEIDLHANSPDCGFERSIDGDGFKTLPIVVGDSRMIVADGLSTDRPHRIQLVRRNESWEGVLDIRSVVLPSDAKLLSPPPLPSRKLLFVGDSITVGSANECMPPDYPKAPRGTNANRSFGIELGRRVNAQVHLVACGGRGLVRDWLGNDNTKTNNAPIFFERSLPDDAFATWDHAMYSPDAIVVGLGANDFSVGIPEQSVWVSAYDTFVKRLRAVHPAAHILLTSSPDFSDDRSNGDFAKAAALDFYLDQTIKNARDRGDGPIEKITLRHQPGTHVDSHPTVEQHLLIADDLEPAIHRILS